MADGVPVSVPKDEVKTESYKPVQRPKLQKEEEQAPFAPSVNSETKKPRTDNSVQPNLWESSEKPLVGSVRTLGENEKSGVFGKFIRSLRTTHRNAVLFTLCMDVGNFFEGNKLILTTESEAVMKGLTRTDNANFLSETLLELGVGEHEVRLIQKGESEMEKAVRELKKNFDGIDIEIK